MNDPQAPTAPLLQLDDLSVTFAMAEGPLHAVRNVNFSMNEGETVCLVGESGCGKSLTAKAIMRLTPANAVLGGRILLHGQNLLDLPEKAMHTVRGRQIGMIFQEPMTALNPVLKIGDQVAEPLRLHEGLGSAQARDAAIELLTEVGIPAPQSRYDDYPHQLSGGMRQRVMIAMALSCRPGLLLADEPTTALDATIQGQILRLLAARCRERRMAVLLITHDLGVAAQMADTVGVMYAGRLVETAPAQDLFADARHPYTQGLLHAAPSARSRGLERLPTIPGTVPSLQNMPTGCPFHPRCKSALPRCKTEMPPTVARGAHSTACWLVNPA